MGLIVKINTKLFVLCIFKNTQQQKRIKKIIELANYSLIGIVNTVLFFKVIVFTINVKN